MRTPLAPAPGTTTDPLRGNADARTGRLARQAAGIIVAATSAVMLSANPASADQFTVENTAPTVSSPSLTMPNSQSGFQPDGGASDEIYTYSVTVGDAETLNDLDKVDVCLYHSLKEDGTAGEGDATCGTINPQNTIKLTWTRSSNTFSISAGASTYWALGTGANASSAPSDLTATSGSLSFKFTVSEVMRAGSWTAKVTASDASANATDSSQSKPVAAYSSITARTQQNFGTVAAGAGPTATTSPTVTSNGATTLSLTAGNFTSGSYSFTLASGTPTTAPTSGQVSFDCMTGGTFMEANAKRIGSTATALGTATSAGTAENGATVSNTCRLKHGGARPVGSYSFTVVNAVSSA